MGQKLEVVWQETATELRKHYRKNRHSKRRNACTPCGKSLKEVAALVGIAYRTLQFLKAWSPDVGIWDGSSAHRGNAMGEVGFERLFLLPYSPELNPCEHVFEWLRARVEGEVYATLQRKRCEIEHHLRGLNADKGHLKSSIGWQWIQDSFAQLSA